MSSASSAKLILEVVAGIVPEQPEPQFTRRYAITSEEWHAKRADQSALLAECNGKAQGYAALLMLQPDRFNWVRTEWIWL